MEAESETKVIDAATGSALRSGESAIERPRSRQVGRYELLHRLGHGGMATVYLGRVVGAAGFSKLVAVKVIHPHLATESDFVDMFLDEARIAAHIHHPHVVEILDLGHDQDTFFMVMEYVEGDTLAALLKLRRDHKPILPLPVALQIIDDACEGLAAAHNLVGPDGEPYHLVHRDTSPQNLLIGLDGRVRVVDFGIMKARGKQSNTLTGQLRGKLAYMSPEQARSQPIDHRSDIFALGAILWELCTGERLFAGKTEAQLLMKVADWKVPDLDSALPNVPDYARRILARALAADVNERYASADDMLRDVRTALRACAGLEDPRTALSQLAHENFAAKLSYIKATVRERSLQGSEDERVETAWHSELGDSEAYRSGVSRASMALAPSTKDAQSVAVPRSWVSRSRFTIATAALVVAAVALLVRRDQASQDRSALAQAEQAPRLASSLPRVDSSDVAGPTHQDSQTVAPANGTMTQGDVPAFVSWSFETDPPGATVYIGGKAHEQLTPVTVAVPRGEIPVEVHVERHGFQSLDMTFVPLGPENLTYKLTPAPSRSVQAKSSSPRFRAVPTPTRSQMNSEAAGLQPAAAPISDDDLSLPDGRTLAEMPDLQPVTARQKRR